MPPGPGSSGRSTRRSESLDLVQRERNVELGVGERLDRLDYALCARRGNGGASISVSEPVTLSRPSSSAPSRAAAYSKLGNYAGAVRDCERAIGIDPNYSKAYGRMG